DGRLGLGGAPLPVVEIAGIPGGRDHAAQDFARDEERGVGRAVVVLGLTASRIGRVGQWIVVEVERLVPGEIDAASMGPVAAIHGDSRKRDAEAAVESRGSARE